MSSLQEWWRRTQREGDRLSLYRPPSFYRQWVERERVPPEACYWFERGLSTWPQSANGDSASAVIYLQEALRHVPAEAVGVQAYIYRWLGKAYLAADQPLRALHAFRQAQALEYAPEIDLWLERCLAALAPSSPDDSR